MTALPTAWRIIGHERAVRGLAQAVAAGRPAHAYLITGPSQVGKRTLARELAAALNCASAADERPCHSCASCRMIEHEAHPDFIVVERSEDKRLSVEQVREARGTVDWRPYQGRFKVYVFVGVDEMSEGGINALLKTIEEPPPQVVVVLTAAQSDAVPSTVLSRCRVIALQDVPSATIVDGLERLKGVNPVEGRRLAALASGRPGWAVAALASPEVVVERAAAVQRAVDLSEGPLNERLLLAAEACKGATFSESRARCLSVLQDMQTWWRELLLLASGQVIDPLFDDRRAEMERQATRRGPARLLRGLRDIEMTASAVERNVTPRLALESLLLRLN